LSSPNFELLSGAFFERVYPSPRLCQARNCQTLDLSGNPFIMLGFFRSDRTYKMVVIRLARGGAKGRPFFSLVVADSRNRRDGRFVERVGFYNPVAAANEQGLTVNVDRLAYWQSNGAQLSPTVARLVKQFKAAKAA
jgi:small subunit ribosomal protein S16